MVGFFKGLTHGMFSGFNDIVEAEDAHQKQLELIKYQNSFKEEVVDPLTYENVHYVDQNGNQQSERLYAIGDRSHMSDTEFENERHRLFFTSNWASKPTMEKLIKTNPDLAGALIRLGDKYAYDIHNNSKVENSTTGEVYYDTTDVFSFAQDSWYRDRFNTISRGLVPTDDYGLPMLKIEAVNGTYYQQYNYASIEEGWGYKTKDELETAATKVKLRTADARSVEQILGDHHPDYWKVYAQTEPIFAKVHNSNQFLDMKSAKQLYDIFNAKDEETGDYLNQTVGGNSAAQLEILRMAAPELMIHTAGSKLFHIRNPETYLRKTLGIDAEQARAKATAASEAILTIEQLMSALFEKDGVTIRKNLQGLPLFGLPAIIKKITEGIFSKAGMIDQIKSLLGTFDLKLENEQSTLTRLQNKFGDRATSGDRQLDNILEREVLYELLAYQVAAAIQGGTGGRTISDADVANIKRALGIGGLTTGPMQAKRLGALLGFMKKIQILNDGFTDVGGGMKSVVAAAHLHKILMQGDMRNYSSTQFQGALEQHMEGKDVEPLDESTKKKIILQGRSFTLDDNGLVSLEAFLQKGDGMKWDDNIKQSMLNAFSREYEKEHNMGDPI